MRVEIDKKALFALASDTRLDILKALQPMRRTVTQLAETLNIDKAAVHRHLKKLEEGGFVKRFEDHGFVYYGLSWKARDILSPNDNTRVIVLLSSSWLLIVLVAFLVIATLQTTMIFSGAAPSETGSGGIDQDYGRASEAAYLPWIMFGVPAIAIAVIAGVIATIGIKTFIRPKQKPTEACKPMQRDSTDDD